MFVTDAETLRMCSRAFCALDRLELCGMMAEDEDIVRGMRWLALEPKVLEYLQKEKRKLPYPSSCPTRKVVDTYNDRSVSLELSVFMDSARLVRVPLLLAILLISGFSRSRKKDSKSQTLTLRSEPPVARMY